MKNFWKKLINLLKKTPPESYIGETSVIHTRQKTLHHYKDYKVIGKWKSLQAINEFGHLIMNEGEMYEETVKFIGEDGKTKLGKRWIPDYQVKK